MADGNDLFDGIRTGLGMKAPVDAVALSNIALFGLQTVDGYVGEDGSHILAIAQTDPTENGIWVMSAGAWVRRKDFDGRKDVVKGTLIPVANRVAAVAVYELRTQDPIDFGTTEIEFAPFASAGQTIIFPEQFGAVGDGVADDTLALQAAIDAAAATLTDTTGGFVSATVTGYGTYRISYGVEVPNKNRLNIHIPGTILVTTWTGGTDFMLTLRSDQSNTYIGKLDGGNVARALRCLGSGMTVEVKMIIHFIVKGFDHSAGGNTRYNGITVQQWSQEDAEFGFDVNWTATGIEINEGDALFHQVNARYCGKPMHFVSGTHNIFTQCHIFNGRPDAIANGWELPVDPVGIQYESTGRNFMNSCYIDCCVVNIRGTYALFFSDCEFLRTINNADVANPVIRYYRDDPDDDYPKRARHSDIKTSIGFFDGTAGAFAGDYTAINDIEDEESSASLVECYVRRFAVIPRDNNLIPAFKYMKPGGYIDIEYHTANSHVRFFAEGTDYKMSGETISFANGQVTPVTHWQMTMNVPNAKFEPMIDKVNTIGAPALRIGKVNTQQVITGSDLPLILWKKAVATQRMTNTTRAKLMVISDSTGTGRGAGGGGSFLTGGYAKAWPARMAAMLTEGGFKVFDQSLWTDQGTVDASYASYDTRVTLGANWSFSALSLGGSMLKYTNGAVNNFSFIPEAAFDKIEIYWYQNTGDGSFATNVDGGASLGTIDCDGGSQTIQKTTFTVADSTHTINIVPNNDGDFFILGIVTYRSTVPGVDLIRACRSGAKVDDFINTALPFRPGNVIPQIDPALTIICLTINDICDNSGTAAYATNLETLIGLCKQAGDVVLMTGAPPNHANGLDNTQYAYTDIVEDLAVEYEAPILRIGNTRIQSRWKTYTEANSYFPYSEPRHPGELGYWDIGRAAADIIRSTL